MEQELVFRNEKERFAPVAHRSGGDSDVSAAKAPPALQLKCADCAQEEAGMQRKADPLQRQSPEEDEMQMKRLAGPLQRQGPEEDEMQMKRAPVQMQSGGGSHMPVGVQSQMESSFGSDFSNVRIHANSETAPQVGALAFTQGSDIHFAPGRYDPASSSGRELLGHELAHVVQQREGRVSATGEVGGLPLNDDKGLEGEADRMGGAVAQEKLEE